MWFVASISPQPINQKKKPKIKFVLLEKPADWAVWSSKKNSCWELKTVSEPCTTLNFKLTRINLCGKATCRDKRQIHTINIIILLGNVTTYSSSVLCQFEHNSAGLLRRSTAETLHWENKWELLKRWMQKANMCNYLTMTVWIFGVKKCNSC